MRLSRILGDVWHFIRRENLHRLLLILLGLVLISALGLIYFEENITWQNAFWWSVVTLTTVGYGDIAPVTAGGRLLGMVIMFLGIGILSMFTATIAGVFVERKLKENRGMGSLNIQDHIIVCEWNHRSQEVVQQLRNDQRQPDIPIVLIAPLAEKPIDDDRLYFVQGSADEETLERANISNATTCIVLGNDELEAHARDAQVVLATLAAESLNPNVYTIVELVHERNVQHCRRASADEIIIGNQFSSRLIASSALDHGISVVLSELLSADVGNDLQKVALPPTLGGQRFLDVMMAMKEQHNSTVLAVQKGGDGAVISNPGMNFRVERGDFLIVIAGQKVGA